MPIERKAMKDKGGFDAPILVEEVRVEYADVGPHRIGLGRWIDAIKRGFEPGPWIVDRVVSSPMRGYYRNFDEFSEKLKRVASDLETLGCPQSDLKFELDVRSAPVSTGDPMHCVLRSTIRRKTRLEAKVNVSNEGQKMAAQASLNLRNYFGGYEVISGDCTTALGKSRYQLDIQKALLNSDSVIGERSVRVRLAESFLDQSAISSFVERQATLAATYQRGAHQFGYEAAFRSIGVTKRATERMQAERGMHLKSSICYRWAQDTRDDPLMPTRGARMLVSAELAGFGGDVRHAKGEVSSNKNYRLSPTCACHLIARAGALWSLFGTASRISDRFSFSEANPFHGFRHYGVGPRLGRDYYRGDTYWTLATHFSNRILENPSASVLVRSVAQLGSCFERRGGNNRAMRASVGAGISVRLAFIRLDLLYSVPLLMSGQDRCSRWQFSLCTDFL